MDFVNQKTYEDLKNFVLFARDYLKRSNDNYSQKKIGEYYKKIENMRELMDANKQSLQLLKSIQAKDERFLDLNKFSKKEIVKAVLAINSKEQEIIQRNIRPLNDMLDIQPKYKWDDSFNPQVDEILQKQNDANLRLLQLIRKCEVDSMK